MLPMWYILSFVTGYAVLDVVIKSFTSPPWK
jgi:hypothetical protein